MTVPAQFSVLQELDISCNSITSLQPLTAARQLQRLVAYSNALSDISPLKSCRSLREVLLQDNAVENIAPLGQLKHLETLRLDRNAVTEIDALAACPKLAHLNVSHNHIQEKTSWRSFAKLRILRADFVQWTSVGQVWAAPALVDLSLAGNELLSLHGLHAAPKLRYLSLDTAGLSAATLQSLPSACVHVVELSLAENLLTSVLEVARLFPNVVRLDLSDNLIREQAVDGHALGSLVPLQSCTDLRELAIAGNPAATARAPTPAHVAVIQLFPELQWLDGQPCWELPGDGRQADAADDGDGSSLEEAAEAPGPSGPPVRSQLRPYSELVTASRHAASELRRMDLAPEQAAAHARQRAAQVSATRDAISRHVDGAHRHAAGRLQGKAERVPTVPRSVAELLHNVQQGLQAAQRGLRANGPVMQALQSSSLIAAALQRTSAPAPAIQRLQRLVKHGQPAPASAAPADAVAAHPAPAPTPSSTAEWLARTPSHTARPAAPQSPSARTRPAAAADSTSEERADVDDTITALVSVVFAEAAAKTEAEIDASDDEPGADGPATQAARQLDAGASWTEDQAAVEEPDDWLRDLAGSHARRGKNKYMALAKRGVGSTSVAPASSTRELTRPASAREHTAPAAPVVPKLALNIAARPATAGTPASSTEPARPGSARPSTARSKLAQALAYARDDEPGVDQAPPAGPASPEPAAPAAAPALRKDVSTGGLHSARGVKLMSRPGSAASTAGRGLPPSRGSTASAASDLWQDLPASSARPASARGDQLSGRAQFAWRPSSSSAQAQPGRTGVASFGAGTLKLAASKARSSARTSAFAQSMGTLQPKRR